MPSTLVSKRVVVTGASAGLGAQSALAFATAGANVVLVARRQYRLERLRKAISKNGGNALMVKADLAAPDDIELVHQTVNAQLGGADILINNAGIYEEGTDIIHTALKDWTRMIDVNLRASYLLCHAFVPGMIARGYGRIINVISGTNTLSGVGPFRISKIGLEVLTAVLAEELPDPHITATAFNPGWMKTETSCTGRSPRGPAQALVDLVQREPTFLNGSFVDLQWSGRKYRLCRRVTGRGQFGLRAF
jgi:short-subunit dehydrogenase